MKVFHMWDNFIYEVVSIPHINDFIYEIFIYDVKFNVAFEVDSSDSSSGRPTVGLYLTNSSLCVLLVNL